MVVIWIKDALKHHTWDADSDKLVKIKLDNIITALIDFYIQLESDVGAVNKNPDKQPSCEKRQVVSHSKTSETLQRPSKQPQTASTSTKKSTIIVLSSDNQKHHKSDNDSDLVFIRGTFPKNLTGGSFPKKNKIIELCPLSKPGENCSQCQVEDRPGGKDLACHCGAKRIWLNGGCVRVAKNHWASEACKEKTDDLKETTELTSYFGRSVTAKNTIEIDCPGLNDNTWKHDRAQVDSCTEISIDYSLDARSKWQIKCHGDRNSIYSSQCSKTFMAKKTIKNAVCPACEDLKHLRSLIKALNMKYAEAETMKYGRDNYMSDNINTFTPTVLKSKHARLLSTLIEKASKGDFSDCCMVLAASARNGLFDNWDATCGLIKAVAVKAEHENAGKTTRACAL
ncbi:uncharacterized protein MELLADRAFT_85319 [Melampsora larici-populina 98AG31]|uniref:Uncharacterized protein n=1 Tax=Melampsora larici-populina (strain 98AG31 / pathotype 3-4-7) TaxID=747676 RepID=F4RIC5_MELLP|nr:uncharacterized protein MELLADRAFT_85319 [Melampsora larici-populina 98AG31]EGG07984.1 hypothetical protein MELLADRAFT_85319 [Melampsora larici-populina 98AG31]